MIQRIYLDVNHWITLSKIHNGLETDPALCTIYEQLDRLSKSGKIVVPFSLFTVIESSRYHSSEGYGDLVDVLVDLSRGYVLKPASYFLEKEIENAMNKITGQGPRHDIRSEILGRGPADMTGLTFSALMHRIPHLTHFALQHTTGCSDGEMVECFRALQNDAGALKACLQNEESIRGVRETYSKADKQMISAESKRYKNSGISRDEFKRRLIVSDFNDNLIDPMSRWSVKQGITASMIKYILTPANVEAFRRSMPAHYTRFALAWARDIKANRLLEPNDFLDLGHLAAAIPYTDVVVTDKMAAYMATSEKLDEMYDCIVLDDLRNLARLSTFN